MKKILCGILFCAMFVCAMNARAQGPDDFDGPDWGYPLSPQQLEQARQFYSGNAGLDKLRQALAANRAALNAELASENPDKGKIESLSREIGELRGKLLAAQVEMRKQFGNQVPPPDFVPDNQPPARAWHRGGHNGWQGNGRHGYGRHGYDGHYGWGCPGMMMGNW